MRRPNALLIVAVAAVALVPVACSKDDGPSGTPAEVPPVALSNPAPEGLKIGVITSSNGAGAAVAAMSGGARVAEYRLEGLEADNEDVELVARDDLGSDEGAQAAVEDLADAGVAGIVYASDGPQVRAGVEAAQAAEIPVVLPYVSDPAVVEGQDGAWMSGVSAPVAAEALNAYVRATDATSVSLVGPNAPVPDGVQLFEDAVALPAENTVDALSAVTDAKAVQDAEAIVAWDSADRLAQVVAALQQSEVAVPVYGPPAMTTARFADQLAALEQGGGQATVDASLFSVAPLSGEVSQGSQVSGFVEALRLAAQNAEVDSVVANGKPLGEDANVGSIDAGAHDAVLLIVAAAGKAESTDAAKVKAALGELEGGSVPGLAGVMPDLSEHDGLTLEQVAVVQADSQAAGQRAELPSPPVITWHQAPQAKQQ